MRALLILACATSLSCADAVTVINANVAAREQAPEYRENEHFHAVITVRNPHPRAVRVTRVDSTCSCLKTDLASSFLIPGETTTLTVDVDNTRRSGLRQERVSLYVSDPDLEPIEVQCWWTVRAAVMVDLIPPGQPALERPADAAWHDIYQYGAEERPDEPQRLRKRIRLASPPAETPPGGLRVEGIDYPGTLWAFDVKAQDNGSVLVTARARDQQGSMPEGFYHEQAVIRTNHPDKARITVQLDALITSKRPPQVNPW